MIGSHSRPTQVLAGATVRVKSSVARIPFTLAFALMIGSAGAVTGSWRGPLNAHVLSRWGFSLHDVWDGTWYSLVTSVFLCNRPVMFWGILIFLFVSVGAYEWRRSTSRAIAMYWLTDLAGALLVTFGVVLPLYMAGTTLGAQLAAADDVGMSGGGFGCLGALVHTLSPRWRARWAAFITLYLILRVIFIPQPFADAVHMVAFPGGYWLDRHFGRMATEKAARR